MTTPFVEHPLEPIVNVAWGGVKIVALYWHFGFFVQADTPGPADPTFTLYLTIGSDVVEIANAQTLFTRADASGAAPGYAIPPTPEMLAYYAIFGPPPYVAAPSSTTHSTGGGYYYINVTVGGVHPDFVYSPYDSFADAESYIDAQTAIYPEYSTNEYSITLYPAYDYYTKYAEFEGLVYINLGYYGPNTSIDLAGAALPDDNFASIQGVIEATLLLGPRESPNIVADFYLSNRYLLQDFTGTITASAPSQTINGSFTYTGGGGGGE